MGKKVLKIVLFIGIIAIVVAGVILGVKPLLKHKEEPKVIERNEVSIDGYGVHLDDLDTDLYRSEYEALKTNLTSGSIDYDAYAESVAKLFVIDLYTIKNKVNKYDVGGVDFVYPQALENFKTNVTDTIYKYVEDNSNNERSQQLPVVKSVKVVSQKKDKFTIKDDKTYDAYVFNLTWDYVVNLGYDIKGEIIVIHKDDRMYVVEKN